ncbi:MAG: AAA family ATPase [Bryobacterales bacterium]|nr:AAA family ATPase [Bryobacterales bacterium]
MIRRLYVHNFRCLENFELPVAGQRSMLLIGKNGSGKTSVGMALRILQQIARGKNRVGDLVEPKDLARGRADVPMRFVLEAELDGSTFRYELALELPSGFQELRVLEESLAVGESQAYRRSLADVQITGRNNREKPPAFRMDWHMVALPVIQEQSPSDPVAVFKRWLARMILLRPVPELMTGESKKETLQPEGNGTNFAEWFTGVMAHAPSAYGKVERYLEELLPDLREIRNPETGRDVRNLEVHFGNDKGVLRVAFEDLSDGEKCFLVAAVVLAANDTYGPLFCFWDEPDNYLALSEVGHFVLGLRKAFGKTGGQFVASSHNPEAIRHFSDETTFLLYRNSHLEPTIVQAVRELPERGDLVGALIRDDVRP